MGCGTRRQRVGSPRGYTLPTRALTGRLCVCQILYGFSGREPRGPSLNAEALKESPDQVW